MIDARERNGFIKSYWNVEQTEGKEEKHKNKKKALEIAISVGVR